MLHFYFKTNIMIYVTVTYLSVTMCPLLFQEYSQTERGGLRVILTHGDWHDFTVSILECKEIMKIYRDHLYGLSIIMSYSCIIFILHNIPID